MSTRKKAVPALYKEPSYPSGSRKTSSELEGNAPIPHDRLMAAIINELARARIRHRALLTILEQHGYIELAEYIAEYAREESLDFMPCVELLLLSPSEFAIKWKDWVEANTNRFGYDGSSRLTVALESSRGGTSEEGSPKRQHRRRKLR